MITVRSGSSTVCLPGACLLACLWHGGGPLSPAVCLRPTALRPLLPSALRCNVGKSAPHLEMLAMPRSNAHQRQAMADATSVVRPDMLVPYALYLHAHTRAAGLRECTACTSSAPLRRASPPPSTSGLQHDADHGALHEPHGHDRGGAMDSHHEDEADAPCRTTSDRARPRL